MQGQKQQERLIGQRFEAKTPEKTCSRWINGINKQTDTATLLVVTSALLLVGLFLFHKPLDLAHTGYLILLGAAIEYTGVYGGGQWHYPDDPVGGVPFWFIDLWGDVGLFMRRLILPILARYENSSSERLRA